MTSFDFNSIAALIDSIKDKANVAEEKIAAVHAALKALSYAVSPKFSPEGIAVSPLHDGVVYYSVIINKEPPQRQVWGENPRLDSIRFMYGRVFKDYEAAAAFNVNLLEEQRQRMLDAGYTQPVVTTAEAVTEDDDDDSSSDYYDDAYYDDADDNDDDYIYSAN